MVSDTNRITVYIHDARPHVMERNGLLWLEVTTRDVANVTLFFNDPLVAIFVGEQLAAAGRRIHDATTKPTAVEEPWTG